MSTSSAAIMRELGMLLGHLEERTYEDPCRSGVESGCPTDH